MRFKFTVSAASTALVVVAGLSSSANGGEDIEVYDVFGFRACIATTDERTILNWQPEILRDAENPTDDTGATVDVEWVSVYDGVVWGRDKNNVAGHWYDIGRSSSDRSWRRFGKDESVSFPADTRIMGRTSTFAWQGFCNSAIDVVPTTDFAGRRMFTVDLQAVQELFLFSHDPKAAFAELVVQSRLGTISADEVITYGELTFSRSIFNRAGPASTKYFVFHRRMDHDCSEWIYAIVIPSNGETIFYRITAVRRPKAERDLPSKPEELLDVHRDVQRIGDVGVRDHTGFGRWNHDVVEYRADGIVQKVRASISLGPARWAVNALVCLLILVALLRTHVLFERRLQ